MESTSTTTRGIVSRRRQAAQAVTVAGVALVALFAGACGTGGGPDQVATGIRAGASVDSVGRLAGSDALVAVVTAGDRVTAYVCDGTTSLGERFTGTVVDGRADLRSASGAVLAIGFSGGGSAGTFTPAGGDPVSFTTTPGDGESGMYFADGQNAAGPYSAGWIELDDGTQTGTARIAGAKSPAPRLKIHKPHTRLGHGNVPAQAPPTKQPAEAGSGGPGRGEAQAPVPAPPAPPAPPTKQPAEAGSGGPGRGEAQAPVPAPPAPPAPPTKQPAEAGSGGPGRGEAQAPVPAPPAPPAPPTAARRGRLRGPRPRRSPGTGPGTARTARTPHEAARRGRLRGPRPRRGPDRPGTARTAPDARRSRVVAGGSGPGRVPVQADPASLDTAEADLARVGRVQAIRVDPQAVRSGANAATSANPPARDLVARRGRVS